MIPKRKQGFIHFCSYHLIFCPVIDSFVFAFFFLYVYRFDNRTRSKIRHDTRQLSMMIMKIHQKLCMYLNLQSFVVGQYLITFILTQLHLLLAHFWFLLRMLLCLVLSLRNLVPLFFYTFIQLSCDTINMQSGRFTWLQVSDRPGTYQQSSSIDLVQNTRVKIEL